MYLNDAYYGQGSGHIFFPKGISCSGDESRLIDCSPNTHLSDCSGHDTDAAIKCNPGTWVHKPHTCDTSQRSTGLYLAPFLEVGIDVILQSGKPMGNEEYYAHAGSSVNLTCQVQSVTVGTETLQWTSLGSEDSIEENLTLEPLQLRHSGNYTCCAIRGQIITSATISLNVIRKWLLLHDNTHTHTQTHTRTHTHTHTHYFWCLDLCSSSFDHHN